jgi:hypothetical protein
MGRTAAFAKGRDFGRITKRGNRHLRTLFMQGARVILLRPTNWAKHSFGLWLTASTQRLYHNVLATVLANKLARIALDRVGARAQCAIAGGPVRRGRPRQRVARAASADDHSCASR